MKTILITGTTQGIGEVLYNHLKDKYNVVTVNRREFRGNNYVCDLSNLNQVIKLCKIMKNKKIDILINNAGGASPSRIKDLSIDELSNVTNLNYHAPVLLMQAVIDNMANKGYGRIINISSIASKSPRQYIPHYGAAKASLESFSKSIAVAYSNYGITVNCLCLGGVNTKTSHDNRRLMASIDDKDEDFYNKKIESENGLNRLISPDEIVAYVDFLLSDDAKSISGQTINVCGVKEVH